MIKNSATESRQGEREEIVRAVLQAIQEFTELDLSGQTQLFETRVAELGFDSLDLMEAIFELECRFDVRLELSKLLHLETIGDVIDAIEDLR